MSGPCTTNQLSVDPPIALSEPAPAASKDKVDDILCLTREGGVEFLNHLLAKAVPPDGSKGLNISNTCKWTFWDILKMSSDNQKEWKEACHKELDPLHRQKVFKLVDPPKGRKVIKN